MRFLIDMNLSPRWADFLRNNDLSADHWSSIGDPGAPDSEIMEYALRQGYIVLTHGLDFSAILAASNEGGPSVVQIRSANVSPITIGATVVAALKQMEQELMTGALLTIDPRRIRLRLLPLQR